ncbi:probable serine/threonine protein kinase IREH1 [Lactuca sativa]|uniref:non-specific serine/threonine protein kinase n=1 Tax=Lactuca sativa TaxID=4236 RepID=A0A9R1XVY5_LACSA|nr:probable serine/threonine protein kinase IREH1 [Lactuca sativa]KAJ0227994.1 hypothetical protein LSAT_V11C100035290 [Lactuca sativa]
MIGRLKSRGYSGGLRSSEICTPEMKTSYDCENPKESESPRFQAILWVTSAPRKRYPTDIKSFSHELNSKGVRPFPLWKPRGLNNVEEVLSMIRGKFDKAKEEVDVDLHIFVGDLLGILEKNAESQPQWQETLEDLLVLAQRCSMTSPGEFWLQCEGIVQELDDRHQELPMGILKQLDTRMLFILRRCTRLLQFHKESRLVEDELVLQLRQSLHSADKRIPPRPLKPPSSSSSSRKSFNQEQHEMLEPKKEKPILKAHPSMSCRTRFGPKSDQGMTTSSAGSMNPRSPLMTPKTSQIDLLLAGKGAYSEHDDLPQMNELADISRCASNTPLDDDRSLSYLLTCLDDLRVVIDRRKVDALTVETFGAGIQKLIREKYWQMCEMVDDEKVDIASTVIDEDVPLEDDVVRSFRTSPMHSRNKDRSSIDDFEIIKPISRGAFGGVFLAKKRTTGDPFAIKVLKKADMIRKNAVESILAEHDIFISILNPFVVRFFYSFTCRENLYLVMEYLNGGDLYSLVRNLGYLDEDVARIYIAEVVLALEYLHSLRVVHLPVIVASTAPFDKQPEVDVSDDEFLQFDTTAIPVIVTLNKGAANIKVAGTDMNNKSSRSHSVFTRWFSNRSSIAIKQLKFHSPMA